MVHTFEESRTRTPVNPNEAAPETAMSQAALEALLRDPVKGLCLPYTPQTLRRWLQTTHPPASAIGAPQAPPPPAPPPPHREGKGHRQGEGKGQEGTARQGGEEGPKVTGRRPQGQGTRGNTTREQETTNGPGRGRTRDRGAERKDATAGIRAHTQEGHATTEGPAPPQPEQTPRDPWRHTRGNTRRRSTNLTPHGPHRLTPTGHRNPHRGRRAHPHGEEGLHQLSESMRAPPRSSPPSPHRQATTLTTARATTETPEEEEDTATAPRARGKDPQRTRDQSTGPQGGQPHGHLPDPPARAAPPDPPSTGPASHPTPNRTLQPPASHKTSTRVPHHETGQSNHHLPHPTPPPRQNTRQHGTTNRSAPPCDAPRQDTPRHDTPQHEAARRGTARHTRARHGATRHDKAGRNTTQHGSARRSTAKHGTSHRGAPKHTRTPKQGTLTAGLTRASRRTPRKTPHQPAAHRQGATARPATTAAARPQKPPQES